MVHIRQKTQHKVCAQDQNWGDNDIEYLYISTHVVFRVVQLNVIREKHTIEPTKSICKMRGRMKDKRHRKSRT